jgi:hypothetical protein
VYWRVEIYNLNTPADDFQGPSQNDMYGEFDHQQETICLTINISGEGRIMMVVVEEEKAPNLPNHPCTL